MSERLKNVVGSIVIALVVLGVLGVISIVSGAPLTWPLLVLVGMIALTLFGLAELQDQKNPPVA